MFSAFFCSLAGFLCPLQATPRLRLAWRVAKDEGNFNFNTNKRWSSSGALSRSSFSPFQSRDTYCLFLEEKTSNFFKEQRRMESDPNNNSTRQLRCSHRLGRHRPVLKKSTALHALSRTRRVFSERWASLVECNHGLDGTHQISWTTESPCKHGECSCSDRHFLYTYHKRATSRASAFLLAESMRRSHFHRQ